MNFVAPHRRDTARKKIYVTAFHPLATTSSADSGRRPLPAGAERIANRLCITARTGNVPCERALWLPDPACMQLHTDSITLSYATRMCVYLRSNVHRMLDISRATTPTVMRIIACRGMILCRNVALLCAVFVRNLSPVISFSTTPTVMRIIACRGMIERPGPVTTPYSLTCGDNLREIVLL